MTDETTQALLPCPPCPICRADATWETALTANVGGKEVIYGSCSECSCTAEYHDWLAHSRPSQASDAGEVDALAEILDPFAFKSWRGMVDYCIGQGDERPDAERYADMTYGAAIAKARVNAEKAIKWIATLSPPTSGEEMRLREALAGLVKWSDNIMRAHGVTGEQIAVTKARAALTKGAE